MARNFNRAGADSLELLTAPVTGAPFTISAWARTDTSTTTDDYCVLQIQDKDVSNNYWRLNADGSGDPGDFAWVARDGASTGTARSGLIPTVGRWHHIVAMEIASNSRRMLVDGANIATNSGNRSPANVDSITIGREGDSSDDDSWSGDLCEIAVWNVALSDAEGIILYKKYSPLFVRPQNLVFYGMLVRSLQEYISGSILTASGTTVSDHPPIIYPSPPMSVSFAAAVAGIPKISPMKHPSRNLTLRM